MTPLDGWRPLNFEDANEALCEVDVGAVDNREPTQELFDRHLAFVEQGEELVAHRVKSRCRDDAVGHGFSFGCSNGKCDNAPAASVV